MMEDLLSLDTVKDIAVITLLKKEISAEDNEDLKDELGALINKGYKKLVIDFEGVKFVSSVILATLVIALKMVRVDNGYINLSSMTDKIKWLFEITRLNRVFGIYNTKEEALKEVSS